MFDEIHTFIDRLRKQQSPIQADTIEEEVNSLYAKGAEMWIGLAFDLKSAPKVDPPRARKRRNPFRNSMLHWGQCWTPKGVDVPSCDTSMSAGMAAAAFLAGLREPVQKLSTSVAINHLGTARPACRGVGVRNSRRRIEQARQRYEARVRPQESKNTRRRFDT
jgi:hypothetical protein